MQNRANDLVLPQSFLPSKHSVIVGKSKISKNAEGNVRLKTIAQLHLSEYAKAETKTEKSKIVSKIVDTIYSKCSVGAFVKHSKEGRWYEVPKSVAREKVGYFFRDLLHDKYKSSSASKAAKRRLSKIGSEQRDPLPQGRQHSEQRGNSVLRSENLLVSVGVTSRAPPTLHVSQKVCYRVETVSCPTQSTLNEIFIPDLEPLPFHGNNEETLVDYGDIIIDDSENSETTPNSEQGHSAVLPTFPPSAVNLMKTKPHDAFLHRVSAISSTPFLHQPYEMPPPENWCREMHSLISVMDAERNKGFLGLSNFMKEHSS